ncbi:hypothetical protein N2599_20065 [Rhizobium sullae]|uniref:Thiaminase-2/PQQC domain-containing protein n=1 Tax=Rhizobium sullae TaxID=50338 RepID=A0ABY5XKB6_RHISU|nr:hypothetical protein [Rhizobium sullae]UWU14378.1 hypothetical protein N2599_20065 [Rhizobium sullae]
MTIAYTCFVLDFGAAADRLDLHVALAPCAVGYAELGRTLAPHGVCVLDGHPYRDWIDEYAGEDNQGIAAAARRHLDELSARTKPEQHFGELANLSTSSRVFVYPPWSSTGSAGPLSPTMSLHTPHVSRTLLALAAVWRRSVSGRIGNDLAQATALRGGCKMALQAPCRYENRRQDEMSAWVALIENTPICG